MINIVAAGIGFAQRSGQIASLPGLGLLTLAGMTPKHHEVRNLKGKSADRGGVCRRPLPVRPRRGGRGLEF